MALEWLWGTGVALGTVACTRSQAQCPASVSGKGQISAFAGKSSTSPKPSPLLLSLQGLSGTVFQLQCPQHLPPVHRVPGPLRLLHASPVHVGNREYPALLHGASALL